MRQGGYWVVYKIVSGRTVERMKRYRRGTPPPQRRHRVKGSSGLKKMEANLKAAIRHLARILNCNFHHGDMHLTLKYDDAHLPTSWQQQEADATAFIRRIKRVMSGGVKWITVCSEKDAESGDPVRPHIHVVITGRGFTWQDDEWFVNGKPLKDIWGKGSVYGEPLHDQADYTALAIYLLRQAGDQADRKKYHVSRNMAKPVIEETVAVTGRELRAPADSKVVERHYELERGVNYIRYITREKTKRKSGDGAGDRESGT